MTASLYNISAVNTSRDSYLPFTVPFPLTQAMRGEGGKAGGMINSVFKWTTRNLIPSGSGNQRGQEVNGSKIANLHHNLICKLKNCDYFAKKSFITFPYVAEIHDSLSSNLN